MTTFMENEKKGETKNEKPTTVPYYDSDRDTLPELVETEDNLEYKRHPKKKHPFSAAHKKDNNTEFKAWDNAYVNLRLTHKPNKKLALPPKPNKKGTQADNRPKVKTIDEDVNQIYNDKKTTILNLTSKKPFFPPGLIQFLPGIHNQIQIAESKKTPYTPTNTIYTNRARMPDWFYTTVYSEEDHSEIETINESSDDQDDNNMTTLIQLEMDFSVARFLEFGQKLMISAILQDQMILSCTCTTSCAPDIKKLC